MMVHCFSILRLSVILLSSLMIYSQASADISAIGSTYDPKFEDVHRILTPSSPSRGSDGRDGGEVVFSVVHRHHPDVLRIIQPSHNVKGMDHIESRSNLIQGSLRRGLQREWSLRRAIREERLSWRSTTPDKGRKLVAEQVSGTVLAASGEYMVQMHLGTPPQPLLLMLDTGSGLTWTQCKQCMQCSPQQEPLFDPSNSSTYNSLSCQSPYCLRSNPSSQFQCNTLNNTCEYGVQYAQSSFTTGIVSKDTLQLANGSMAVSDFLFGCGLFNLGDFGGSSGLLGLSRSNVSFPSQLGMQHPTLGRKFSYCFADLAQNLSATGFISFGNSSSSNSSSDNSQNVTGPHGHQLKTMYTQFAATPFPTQFYYLGLTGISLEGKLLPINSTVLEMDPDGNGGTVIDSGTTLTLLNPEAYEGLRDAFRAAAAAKGKLPKVSTGAFNSTGHEIDTCYQIDDHGLLNQTSSQSNSGWRAERLEEAAVPSIALHFAGDLEVVLPPDSVLFPFDEGVYCLAFASTLTDLGINVIGNIQQQNLRIEYDLENSRIGFESVVSCAR